VEKLNQLQALNGIRGMAILFVMLAHASNRKISVVPWLDFSGSGRYGVFLFFVLSAFLLTRQFIVAAPGRNEALAFLRQYFKRRFWRIYPLYAIALLTYLAFIKLGHPGVMGIGERGYLNGHDVLKGLLLMDAKGFFWTIPVEFQYYFLLPLVAFALIAGGGRIWLVVFAIALFISGWVRFSPPNYAPNVLPFLPVFLIGSLAAYLYTNLGEVWLYKMRAIGAVISANVVSIGCLLSFLVLVTSFYNAIFGTYVPRNYFHLQFILFAVLSAGLILSTLVAPGPIQQLMTSRFMVFWGKVSFSAYLWHLMVLYFLLPIHLPATAIWVLFMAITAAISWLSYRVIEQPLSMVAMGTR
jgi:peptidoglycan/LPS O-acetylase OafA/YrhL